VGNIGETSARTGAKIHVANMTRKPKITVVTVVYNAVKDIEKTIQSVTAQTCPNLEYIVIDGGSKDGTLDIIRRYDSRITVWLSEPDKGIYDAMNKAIDRATGDWINFMNAGDYFYSDDAISQLFALPDEEYDGYAVIYGDTEFRLKTFSYVIEAMNSQSDRFMPFSHQAAFTRIEYAKKNRYDTRYRIAADTEFFLKLTRQGLLFTRIPVIVASYNSQQGLSADNELRRSKELVDMQVRYGADKNSPYYKKYIRNAFIKQLFRRITPGFLWIKIRERKVKQQLQKNGKH
jgi:glycosyltransferase involved in cell wall biosynthesis